MFTGKENCKVREIAAQVLRIFEFFSILRRCKEKVALRSLFAQLKKIGVRTDYAEKENGNRLAAVPF